MMKTLIILLICHPVSYRQLTWADFKGKAPATSWNNALTTTHIELSIEGDGSKWVYVITCGFCPEESWTRTHDSATLAHENAHFALSEAFAREIRHDLEQYQGTGKRTAAEALYDHMIQKWNQEQEDYDKKTDHGRDKIEQAWWENYIHTQLIKYP